MPNDPVDPKDPVEPPTDSTPPADPPKDPVDPPKDPVDPKEPPQEPKEPKQVTPDPTPPTDEPKTPVERVVPAVDDYKLPEGMPKEMAEFANENDLTQEQLDKTLTKFKEFTDGSRQGEKAQILEDGTAHVKTWGDQAQNNLAIVHRAVKQNDPSGTMKTMLDNSGFGNHPDVLDFLLRVGKNMQEGGFLSSEVNVPPGKKTAAQSMFGDTHPSKDY